MLCSICKCSQTSANSLTRHLKVAHGLCSGKTLKILCGQDGCTKVYGTFSGFRKHLNKAHKSCSNVPVEGPSTEDVTFSDFDETESTSSPCKSVVYNLIENCAATVAELKVAGIGETTINSLVNSLEEIVADIHSQTKEELKKCLHDGQPVINDVDKKIDQCFENIENPFSVLNSESKRRHYFKEKWGRVDPVEHVLGTRFDTLHNRTTGAYDQVVVTDRFMYVPILKTLELIYSHPRIKDMIISDPCSKEYLSDFCDGELYKSHPLFVKQSHGIQLQLFFDEFETANPLGSK